MTLVDFRNHCHYIKQRNILLGETKGIPVQNFLLQSSVLLAESLLLVGYTLFILLDVMFVTCSKLEAFNICNGNIFSTVSWIF